MDTCILVLYWFLFLFVDHFMADSSSIHRGSDGRFASVDEEAASSKRRKVSAEVEEAEVEAKVEEPNENPSGPEPEEKGAEEPIVKSESKEEESKEVSEPEEDSRGDSMDDPLVLGEDSEEESSNDSVAGLGAALPVQQDSKEEESEGELVPSQLARLGKRADKGICEAKFVFDSHMTRKCRYLEKIIDEQEIAVQKWEQATRNANRASRYKLEKEFTKALQELEGTNRELQRALRVQKNDLKMAYQAGWTERNELPVYCENCGLTAPPTSLGWATTYEVSLAMQHLRESAKPSF